MAVYFRPITMKYAVPPIDCGADDIQQMMSEAYILTLQKQGLAYNVFLNDRVVGQFMLRMYSIDDANYETSIGKHEFPCIKIEYLGIDKELQGKGIGTETLLRILKMCREITNKLPVRFILIESVQNLEEWHSRFAFTRLAEGVTVPKSSNGEYTVPMCIDCMDFEAVDKYNEWLVG